MFSECYVLVHEQSPKFRSANVAISTPNARAKLDDDPAIMLPDEARLVAIEPGPGVYQKQQKITKHVPN